MGTKKQIRGAELHIKKLNLEWKCQKCGNTEWNGAKIPLQLHHIDGNHYNNNVNNLEILCPNCHAQTDNYCSKNRKKVKTIYYCKECGAELYGQCKTGLCKKCSNEAEKKKSRCPSKEILEEDFRILKTYSAVGRKYQVSNKTARKWADKLKIF